MNNYDLLIIGAGAAGIMGALSARQTHPDFKIGLIDKNSIVGRKILICGAGRCNLTNINLSTDRFYGAPTNFIASIINQFPSQSIRNFFNDLGVEIYEEVKNGRRKGKIFPITNQAATITELLASELERQNIELILNTEVKDIVKDEADFTITISNSEGNSIELKSKKLILASGGKTYPRLGATGFGYDIAQKLGHSLIEPVPSALPLQIKDDLVTQLSGIRFDVEVTSLINNEKVKIDTDEILFTKYGLSGPVILNVSREVSVRLNRDKTNDVDLVINFFPGKTSEQVFTLLNNRWVNRPNQHVKHSLYGLLPNKIVDGILKHLVINPEKFASDLSRDEKADLVAILSQWKLKVSATKGWEDGEFTAGGVNTKEIKSNSLESKIIPGLYFAGEVVNVDGDVGGFNLSWAWASGNVSGKLL